MMVSGASQWKQNGFCDWISRFRHGTLTCAESLKNSNVFVDLAIVSCVFMASMWLGTYWVRTISLI